MHRSRVFSFAFSKTPPSLKSIKTVKEGGEQAKKYAPTQPFLSGFSSVLLLLYYAFVCKSQLAIAFNSYHYSVCGIEKIIMLMLTFVGEQTKIIFKFLSFHHSDCFFVFMVFCCVFCIACNFSVFVFVLSIQVGLERIVSIHIITHCND